MSLHNWLNSVDNSCLMLHDFRNLKNLNGALLDMRTDAQTKFYSFTLKDRFAHTNVFSRVSHFYWRYHHLFPFDAVNSYCLFQPNWSHRIGFNKRLFSNSQSTVATKHLRLAQIDTTEWQSKQAKVTSPILCFQGGELERQEALPAAATVLRQCFLSRGLVFWQ